MLFARRLQVEGGREIVYSTAHASFKGEPQGKKDNESVVLHCIIYFESKPYPQAYRCEQGHALCSMIRGGRHECLFQWSAWSRFDSCNLEVQRLLPMNSIRSVRRDRPITRNIISGGVKDASIAIAAIQFLIHRN
jgi:hypothetical protein